MIPPAVRPTWRELLLLAAIVLVGAGRIAATWRQLSATFDEPVHLESGIEWLQYGRLSVNVMHPPLSRALIATGPYLDGVRWQNQPDWQTEGMAELHARGTTGGRWLSLGRACCRSSCWRSWPPGGWPAGSSAATWRLASAGALCMVPPVLAHAGLATTDFAVAALMPVVIAAGMRWLDAPTRGARCCWAGRWGSRCCSSSRPWCSCPPRC